MCGGGGGGRGGQGIASEKVRRPCEVQTCNEKKRAGRGFVDGEGRLCCCTVIECSWVGSAGGWLHRASLNRSRQQAHAKGATSTLFHLTP